MSCWLSWVPDSQWLHFCVYISSNRFSFYCLLVPKYRSDDTIVYPIRMKKVTFKLKESTWNGWRKSWEFFFSSFLRLLQFTYDCGHYDIRDGSMSYGRFFLGFGISMRPHAFHRKKFNLVNLHSRFHYQNYAIVAFFVIYFHSMILRKESIFLG